MTDNEIFKKHFAKNIATDLENEKCRCVQISLAKLCNEVPLTYSKSLDKIRNKLITDGDPTVIQYMPKSSEKSKQAEKDRRFLALNYGEGVQQKKGEKPAKEGIDGELTEDEWLERERKEIEEIEKTVTIRFANYSTLMRA